MSESAPMSLSSSSSESSPDQQHVDQHRDATNPDLAESDLPDSPEEDDETGDDDEPKYGSHTRFEMELEFVQSLANPEYVNYLASRKLLTNPSFVAYLDYLQYWSRPPYLQYLTYPSASLKMLQLLQEERFRKDIIAPHLTQGLLVEGMKAAVEWHREG
ncbi:SOH1-domain-containing protein [Podospora australis]|uniref:Mediator of RNA polymerase II transcription subunit 31 n=1 Tax=Podospora australis TaxID=1536484 RepID=A0AAN6X0B7_9PEZI|nr:SOH1-domain-containing protein [Podospora australis]